ncbi:FAD-binding molybdopterin dehydrogenase [Bordetella genomosp. 8]|uniref:FAD-binding molybdopterin dehydrogenase n=1 Tax=Bordetella genomosp. 8 TaxID=1416806 RepID=A0A1W6YPG7_9BORD|nr:xanthine dehydrogenase family protein subunit M [Bordetella genomosp. 8]ARP82990.1 FAD-binding molybdopterin dehydrogenase [Bordetella genomosp. 8]
MRSFEYVRAADVAGAAALKDRGARVLAGGTTLVDLMKCNVERPASLVDITRITGLDYIEAGDEWIRIGSLARMSAVADHPGIKAAAPVLAESLARAASAQIRNMATMGGNLLQRTRCPYFRDVAGASPCNKRVPGSGCAALDGVNRNHAVLGGSEACIAVYPGDFATALAAFDGRIRIQGGKERVVVADEFFKTPGGTPDIENSLMPGEIITAIEIPVTAALRYSHYLKVRDRASYEFAAASAAVGVELESDGTTIKDVRVALGGVATKPWRARGVEAELAGKPFTESVIRAAANRATEGAVARQHNTYKITLLPRVVTRALLEARRVA